MLTSFSFCLLFFSFCDKFKLIFIAVPATYPMDEELIKLCMVDQLFRLGLAEHFVQETEDVLAQVYR